MRARSRGGSSPGLRACTGLSRHSSVVSSIPRPFTSMLPPSSTRPGCHASQFQPCARAEPVTRVVPLPVVVLGPAVEAPIGDGNFAASRCCTKIGPKSRVQTRSVGHAKELDRIQIRVALFAECARAPSSAIAHPRPECARAPRAPACARSRRRPTGSARTFRASRSRLWGQASQVASCGSHSAGMRKPHGRRGRFHRCQSISRVRMGA